MMRDGGRLSKASISSEWPNTVEQELEKHHILLLNDARSWAGEENVGFPFTWNWHKSTCLFRFIDTISGGLI